MNIKILGTGCPNCRTLESRAKEAAFQLNLEANFEKVEDIEKIISYGIMKTPALVINENVVVSGRVPSVEEIKEILKNHS